MTNVLDDNDRPAPGWSPPGGAPAPPWRIIRARDGWIGGVCGGLAVSAGIDLAVVRIAFALAAPSGLGFLAYLALWILTPRAGSDGVPDPQPAPPQTANTIKILLLVGALIAAGGLWFLDPFPSDDVGGLIGLLLIGLGIAWLARRRAGQGAGAPSASPAPPPPPPPASAPSSFPPPSVEPAPTAGVVSTTEAGVTDAGQQPVGATGGVHDATLGMSPPPQRDDGWGMDHAPRGGGGSLVLAVVMWLGVLAAIGFKLVAGALIGFEAVGLPGAGVYLTLSTVLLVVMIVAAAMRRAGIFGLAVVGMVALISVGTAFASFNGDLDRQIERVASVAQLDTVFENAVGHLSLDLTRIDLDGTTATATVKEGIGRLDVVVPDDVTIEVDYDVQLGEVDMFGGTRDVFYETRTEVSPGVEGAGTLRIDAEIGAGDFRVCRAAAADLIDMTCPDY